VTNAVESVRLRQNIYWQHMVPW